MAANTRARLLVMIGTIVAVTAPDTSATHYDNMYKTGNLAQDCVDNHSLFCQTDNATLTWYDEASITYAGRDSITSVLENSFEATDLSVSFQSPPSYSGDAETDIIYRKVTLPAGVLGQAYCNDAVSSTRCDQHYVDFSVSSPDVKTICHESGHAVGLTHGADAYPAISSGDDSLGCMQTPFSEISGSTLGSHNSAQINATY